MDRPGISATSAPCRFCSRACTNPIHPASSHKLLSSSRTPRRRLAGAVTRTAAPNCASRAVGTTNSASTSEPSSAGRLLGSSAPRNGSRRDGPAWPATAPWAVTLAAYWAYGPCSGRSPLLRSPLAAQRFGRGSSAGSVAGRRADASQGRRDGPGADRCHRAMITQSPNKTTSAAAATQTVATAVPAAGERRGPGCRVRRRRGAGREPEQRQGDQGDDRDAWRPATPRTRRAAISSGRSCRCLLAHAAAGAGTATVRGRR